MASAGVEAVAELGNTATFESEIKANMNAVAVIEKSLPSGGTPTATVDFTVTTAHPLVTLLTMIAPSPDWFVGVSGLSLLDAQGDWLAAHMVDLFPYDAGTEEGTEFSLNNAATSPQGTITSIKGTGKFSNEPIATLTFTRQSVTPEITSETTFTVDEGTTAVETLDATDQDSAAADLAWSKAGGADAGQFMLSADGELAFAAAPDYENPDDADGVTGTTRWTSGSVLPAGPVDEAQTLVRGPYLQSGTAEVPGGVPLHPLRPSERSGRSQRRRPEKGPRQPALKSWARDRHVGRGTADMTAATNARQSSTLAKTTPRLL